MSKKAAPAKAAASKAASGKAAPAAAQPHAPLPLTLQGGPDRGAEHPAPTYDPAELVSLDQQLPRLPQTYGESYILLLPRDPAWLFVCWELSAEQRDQARQAPGAELVIRLYDITGRELQLQAPHSVHDHPCPHWARSWYLPVPCSGREYQVEIGVRTDQGFVSLIRSARVTAPLAAAATVQPAPLATIDFDGDLTQAGDDLLEVLHEEGPPLGEQVLVDEEGLRIVYGEGWPPAWSRPTRPGACSPGSQAPGSQLEASGGRQPWRGLDRRRGSRRSPRGPGAALRAPGQRGPWRRRAGLGRRPGRGPVAGVGGGAGLWPGRARGRGERGRPAGPLRPRRGLQPAHPRARGHPARAPARPAA